MLPEHSEVTGLLALMPLNDARRPARTGENGELIPRGRRQDDQRTGAAVPDHPGGQAQQVAYQARIRPDQADLTVRWRSPSIVQIPGTSSLAHLEKNMAAADIHLDEADMALLGPHPSASGGSSG